MNRELSLLAVALLLLTAGFAMAWLPLGPIVLGGLLLTGLIWTRLRTVDKETTEEQE